MRVLLICGSTRDGSSNALALTALHEFELPNITTDYYTGLRDLPAFVPAMDRTPAVVRDLLRRIAEADAVVFSTSEYAGGLPGALKNLPHAAVEAVHREVHTSRGHHPCPDVAQDRLHDSARQELADAAAALAAADEENS